MIKRLSSLWKNFRRTSFEIGMMFCVALAAFFAPEFILPEMAKIGLTNIFISKLIFISAGILHAHISRKMLFPYIDFANERRWDNNVMIIAWYIVIIWGWARGG